MKPNKILPNIYQTYNSQSQSNRRELFVNDLVQHHRWTVGAEIGVRTGRTLFCLLQNPNLSMYAVDRDVGQFYNPKIEQQYGARLMVLDGVSWEVADSVPNQSLDFFFIDAGHSYKSVIRDLDAWMPKLKPTGWFIGHDINFIGVNQAVVEKFGTYEVGPDNVWFIAPDKNYSFLKKI